MNLLLTTAIVPHCKVAISSPTIRLAQVLQSLERWKQEPLITRIIVVDTTDFTPVNEIDGVEWIASDQRSIAMKYGKGRAEALAIEDACLKQPLLDKEGFWKTTGRLSVDNFSDIFNDVLITDSLAGVLQGDGTMDTRLFWCGPKFFLDTLSRVTEHIDDLRRVTYIESIYGGILRCHHCIKTLPVYIGRGGQENNVLNVDYPNLPIEEAEKMLPQQDVSIFCLYHNAQIKDYQQRGFIDPDADHVVYVKAKSSPFTYKCKNHLDMYAQSWHRPINKGFAEYELMRSLYYAERNCDIELPEYVGFTHYDMDVKSIDIKTPLRSDSILAFNAFTIGDMKAQNLDQNGVEIIDEMLRIAGVTEYEDREYLCMCSAMVMHKSVFMRLMAKVVRAMEEPTSIINQQSQRSKKDPRWMGGMCERYLPALIFKEGLRIIHQYITHDWVQSCPRCVRAPDPSEELGWNAGVYSLDDGFITSERFVYNGKGGVVFRRWNNKWEHLYDLQDGTIMGIEDIRFITYHGKPLGYGTIVKDDTVRMCIIKLDEKQIIEVLTLHADFQLGKTEKNWVLFTDHGRLLAAYSLIPHLILSVNTETGLCRKAAISAGEDWQWPYGEIRGGSSPILLGDVYLAAFHSMITGLEYQRFHPMAKHICPKHYFVGWYLFEAKSPYRVIAASEKPFQLPHIQDRKEIDIDFPISLLRDGSDIIISYGENDLRTRIERIKIDDIKLTLRPITTARTPLGVIRAA